MGLLYDSVFFSCVHLSLGFFVRWSECVSSVEILMAKEWLTYIIVNRIVCITCENRLLNFEYSSFYCSTPFAPNAIAIASVSNSKIFPFVMSNTLHSQPAVGFLTFKLSRSIGAGKEKKTKTNDHKQTCSNFKSESNTEEFNLK